MRCGVLTALFVVLPAAAPAQGLAEYDYENLSFRGIGADWGHIWPNKADATSMYSLRVDLGFLGPAIRIVPGLHYWNSSMKRSEVGRVAERLSSLPALQESGVIINADDLGEIDWKSVSMTLDAQAVWTAPYRIFTFIGLGAGLHAMNGSGSSIDDTFIEDLLDTITPGMAVMAGIEYEPSPSLRLYGEGRYTVQSEVRYPGFRIGAALMIPNRAGGAQ
jgi:opacity protein-like surface antigen